MVPPNVVPIHGTAFCPPTHYHPEAIKQIQKSWLSDLQSQFPWILPKKYTGHLVRTLDFLSSEPQSYVY